MFTVSEKQLENSVLVMEKNGYPYVKTNKQKQPLQPYLTPSMEINLKWPVNTNVDLKL